VKLKWTKPKLIPLSDRRAAFAVCESGSNPNPGTNCTNGTNVGNKCESGYEPK
jgi:hypothetical protein